MKIFILIVAYLGFMGGILYLGWNEPLRYRFMSREEIANLQPRPTPAAVTPTPPPPPRGQTLLPSNTGHTALDRDNPWNQGSPSSGPPPRR